MEALVYLTAALAAYLVGSFPSGYLMGKARGIDIRTLGSGNIGATNAFRLLGKPAGIAVLLLDGLKGYLACTAVVTLVLICFGVDRPDARLLAPLAVLSGVCAVLGHNYTCWLRFKGGKGIATSAGVLLALAPGGLLVAATTWAVVAVTSRYVSLASIAAALVLPAAVWFTGGPTLVLLLTAGLSALAIYKHKPNIQRLLAGSEHRIGSKKNPASTPPPPTATICL